MPREINITFDDGSSHIYQNVPDNVTPDQVEARASKEFQGKKVKNIAGKSNSEYNPSLTSKITGAVVGYGKDYAQGIGHAVANLATSGSATANQGALATAGSMIAAPFKSAVGIGETGLSLVGGIAGDVAGAVAGTATQDATTGAKIRDAITKFTAPRTEAGKATSETLGAVLKPAGDLMELIPKYLEEHGHGVAAQDLRAILDVAGGEELALGKGAKGAAKALSKDTVLSVDEALTADRASKATKEGYQVNKAMQTKADSSIIEGLSGKKYLDQKLTKKNQENTNKLVRQGLGLPEDAPLTKDTLTAVRKVASQDYEALKNVTDKNIKPSTDLYKALDDAASSYTGSIRGGKNTPVVKIVNDLKRTTRKGYTIDQALKEVQVLKDEADKAFATGDKALGKATRAIRDAVEDSIEQHLKDTNQDPKLVQKVKDARKLYAQTYSVEGALDGAGNVDARKLATQIKKDKPLTGPIRTAGEFGGAFPRIAGTPKEEPHGFGLSHAIGAVTGHIAATALTLGAQKVARAVAERQSRKAKSAAEINAENSAKAKADRRQKKARQATAAATTADELQREQQEAR